MSFPIDSMSKPIFSRMEYILLFLVGVDPQILSRSRNSLDSDVKQFYSEGLCIAILVFLATLSGGIFFYELLSPLGFNDFGSSHAIYFFRWFAIIGGAILSGLYVLNLQKFIIFCRNGLANKKMSGFRQYGRWVFAVAFSILCGFMIAVPLQIALFKSEIQVTYHYQLLKKIEADFERISNAYQPYFREVFQRAYEGGQVESVMNSSTSREVKPIRDSVALGKDRGIKVENLSMSISTLNPVTGQYEPQMNSVKEMPPQSDTKVKKDLVSDSSKVISPAKNSKELVQDISKNEGQAEDVSIKKLTKVQDPSVTNSPSKKIVTDKTTNNAKTVIPEVIIKDKAIIPSAEEKPVTSLVVEVKKNKESPLIPVPVTLDLLDMRGRDLACFNAMIAPNKLSNLMLNKDGILDCAREVDKLLQEKNVQISALDANKNDSASISSLRVDQISLEMQKEKLMVLLNTSPNPGIIQASSIAFEELQLFSWLLILSIIFIQCMPILMKVFGSRIAYDYLVDEQMRLTLAKNAGVEYQAYEIFNQKSESVYVTFFHSAIDLRSKVSDRLHQLKVVLRDNRMEKMKSKFNDIWKHSNQ